MSRCIVYKKSFLILASIPVLFAKKVFLFMPRRRNNKRKRFENEIKWVDLDDWSKEFFEFKGNLQIRVTYEGDDLDTNKYSHQVMLECIRKEFPELSLEIKDEFADESTLFIASGLSREQLNHWKHELKFHDVTESSYNLDYPEKKKTRQQEASSQERQDKEERKEEEEEEEEDTSTSTAQNDDWFFLHYHSLDQMVSKLIFRKEPFTRHPLDLDQFQKETIEFTTTFYWSYLFDCVQMASGCRDDLYEEISAQSEEISVNPINSRDDVCHGCQSKKQVTVVVKFKDRKLEFGSTCAKKVIIMIRFWKWMRDLIYGILEPPKDTTKSIAQHIQELVRRLQDIMVDAKALQHLS